MMISTTLQEERCVLTKTFAPQPNLSDNGGREEECLLSATLSDVSRPPYTLSFDAIGGATIPQMHLSSANFACNPMPPALHREVAFLFSCPPERGEFSSPIPLTLHDRYYFDDVANDRMRPFQERARAVGFAERARRAGGD